MIDEVVTNGTCVVNCLRDFNGNGVYDEGLDILYSRTLIRSDNGKTAAWTVGDADGDGQLDSVEIAHETSPIDPRNYCFNLAFVEKGIFATTNQLTAEVLFGTNVLVGPVVMTNRTWECDLGHLVASNREAVVAYFWDDSNSNGVREAEECSTRQSLSLKGHENVVTNTLALGAFDRDNDGMLDHWELLHADAGLSPTNSADAFVDFDSDGLINLHEYWAKCNPAVPDGSNTVLSIMARSVDGRLVATDVNNTKCKCANYRTNGYSHMFFTNSNFWATEVDTTCASVWNNFAWPGEFRKAGTLISPRHMVFANHFPAEVNKTVWFVGTDGNVYSNKIANVKTIIGTDIQIALLATNTDEHVNSAMMLPKGFANYIHAAKGLPVLAFDYDERGIVYEIKGDLQIAGSHPRQQISSATYTVHSMLTSLFL